MAYIPERGDIVWITLDPQVGHEQAGRRPSLVLSRSAYNGRLHMALICPITNRAKGYPFEVTIPLGLEVSGIILSDQIKCLDWYQRQADFICRVPDAVIVDVLDRLDTLLY